MAVGNSHVLHAVHTMAPEPMGGTERHVLGLARAQGAQGMRATVVAGTLRWREQLAVSEDDSAGVAVLRVHRDDFNYERWHKAYHPGVSRQFDEILRRERPDVVHVHHWLRLSADLVQCAAAAGIPSVVTLHDSFATCPTVHRVLPDGLLCQRDASWSACAPCLAATQEPGAELSHLALDLRQQILRAELAAANRVLVLSRAQGELLSPLLAGISCTVQPFAAFERLHHSPVPPPPPPLHVACMGRLNAGKAPDVLLDAVGSLPPAQREQVLVHLFGAVAPEFSARLDTAARGLPVVRHGEFDRGLLEATPLHLVVLTSRLPETYGLVLDEAQMLGVPVAASAVGAYPERIGAGGVLFPPGDARALAAVLARALAEPGFLAALRARVPSPPEPTAMLAFLERTYAGVVAEGARPAPARWRTAALEYLHGLADHRERQLEEARARVQVSNVGPR